MLRSTLVAIAMLGSLGCFLLGIIAWRKRPAPGAGFIAGALFSAAIYALGYGFELSSNSLEAIFASLRLEYLGIVWLPGFWLAMSLRYTNHLTWLKFPRFLLLWIVPTIVLVAFFSNPLHQLYYTNISLNTSGPFPVIQFDHGPIYLVQEGYNYFALMVSSFLLFQNHRSPHALYRKQTDLILLSNLLVLLVLILYFSGIVPIPNLDIAVYVIIFASFIIGFGLLRYRLVDLLPAARETLFDRLSDGVLVLDGKGRLIDFNPKAHQILGLVEKSIGSSLPELIPPEILPAFTDLRSSSEHREFLVESSTSRYYEIRASTISLLNEEREGLLVMVHDISPLKQMQIALEAMNADLDQRVKARTQENLVTIDRLEKEVTRRQGIEKKLQEMQENLVEQVSIQSRKLYSLYDVLINKEVISGTGEVLSQTLDRIKQMMKADAACIHEARDGNMYRFGSVGLPEKIMNTLEILPIGWLKDGKPLMSTGLAHEERVPEALRLAMYTSYLAAPIRIHETITGVLQVFWCEPKNISVEDISYFSIIAEQIGIILENDRLRKKLEERAIQSERRRLARDLHDSVTQSLHSLLLSVEVLRHRIEQGKMEKAEEMLARLEQSAHQALKEMRLLLFEQRLVPLEEIHLIDALESRLQAVEIRARIDARLQIDELAQWPHKWEAEMYCIAMEALNNSLKHARATQVCVELRGEANWVEMCIKDNGKGFSTESKKTGFGLQSMQERAKRLGGRLVIESEDNLGTCICLQVGQPTAEMKGEIQIHG